MEIISSVFGFIGKALMTLIIVGCVVVGIFIFEWLRDTYRRAKFESDLRRSGFEIVSAPLERYDHILSPSIRQVLRPNRPESQWIHRDTIARWKQARNESMHAYQAVQKMAWDAYTERSITNSEYVEVCKVAEMQYRNESYAYERLALTKGLPSQTARLLRLAFYDYDFQPIEEPPALSPLRKKSTASNMTSAVKEDTGETVIPFRYPV
jgi:hypothetical protein